VVEVVQALLVACSRTYTLDRTFDLGSQDIAHGDDGESAATGYDETSIGLELRSARKLGSLKNSLTSRRALAFRLALQFRVSLCRHDLQTTETILLQRENSQKRTNDRSPLRLASPVIIQRGKLFDKKGKVQLRNRYLSLSGGSNHEAARDRPG